MQKNLRLSIIIFPKFSTIGRSVGSVIILSFVDERINMLKKGVL